MNTQPNGESVPAKYQRWRESLKDERNFALTIGADELTELLDLLDALNGQVNRYMTTMRRYQDALDAIENASRDDGLSAMCNWMRNRALVALSGGHFDGGQS